MVVETISSSLDPITNELLQQSCIESNVLDIWSVLQCACRVRWIVDGGISARLLPAQAFINGLIEQWHYRFQRIPGRVSLLKSGLLGCDIAIVSLLLQTHTIIQ
jgi:hypothetical protein